jgi:hypothetical protein
MQHNGESYLKVDKMDAPPMIDEFGDVLMGEVRKGLVAGPTLVSVNLQKEEATAPAGLMFLQEAWTEGFRSWVNVSSTGNAENRDSEIARAVGSACENPDGGLDHYLWCVFIDLQGYKHTNDLTASGRDEWLQTIAEVFARQAYNHTEADRAGGC